MELFRVYIQDILSIIRNRRGKRRIWSSLLASTPVFARGRIEPEVLFIGIDGYLSLPISSIQFDTVIL